MHEAGRLAISVDLFRAQRDAIRNAIETHGYNTQLGSYTRTFDGNELDASLLTLPLYDYVSATHPRMRSTCLRIHEQLARGSLLYRYETGTSDDGLPSGEGTFGICSFWGVECMARAGDIAGATRTFEELLAYANDVGLLAEEIDPDTGAALGNFPQAFTHVGLINAALTLAECRGEGALAQAATEAGTGTSTTHR
jgi:GH15 family glucan-1,4-alpha-glucosidase